jgi:hypothetical protein
MTASYMRQTLKQGPARVAALERDAVHQKLEIWDEGKVKESRRCPSSRRALTFALW